MNKSCKDCTDRHVGCHSTCDTYKENCKKWEEIRKKRIKANDEESFYRAVRSHNRSRGR